MISTSGTPGNGKEVGARRGAMLTLAPRVAVALGLGVVTTVGVSWGSAAWVDLEDARVRSDGLVARGRAFQTEAISTPLADGFKWFDEGMGEAAKWHARRSLEPVPRWSLIHNAERAEVVLARSRRIAAEGLRAMVFEVATGWPMRAMVARYTWPTTSNECYSCIEGIVLPRRPAASQGFAIVSRRALPLSVYWPGFLANASVYAAAWAVPVVAVPVARRSWRRRRGLCEACGYSRSGLAMGAKCPECGEGPSYSRAA